MINRQISLGVVYLVYIDCLLQGVLSSINRPILQTPLSDFFYALPQHDLSCFRILVPMLVAFAPVSTPETLEGPEDVPPPVMETTCLLRHIPPSPCMDEGPRYRVCCKVKENAEMPRP